MNFQQTDTLEAYQKRTLMKLWNAEYPENLMHYRLESFQKYLNTLKDTRYILLIDNTEEIVGWYVDFTRDSEKWFAMIIDSRFHGNGFGKEILSTAKQHLKELNGWVIDDSNYRKRNGQLYRSPVSFYLKNGFKLLPEVRLELEKFSAVKIQWKR
jgi:GNAT superfamily N-acetyltransferase